MSKDIKKYIKEFIRNVETLENEEDTEGNGFNREYRMIHEIQLKNRKENAFTMDAGKNENNVKKNRYKDILPYDEHRVVLSTLEGEKDSDYINASKLMGVKGTGGYIASQGPLATTVSDFWRMIWENNVEIIFMACRIVELGKIKCKQYWNDVGKSEEFLDISVFTESEEEIASDFIQRKLHVTRDGKTRHVTQFHYSGWPDHGIPDDPAHIRDLIGIMRRTRVNDEAPLLVHCSAGCGRTGAIIAIDFVWTLLEEGKFDATFSLYELICNFREQRMSIVQTAEQYELVNQVLKSLCEEWLGKMAKHTYVNVEVAPEYDNVNNGPPPEETPYEEFEPGKLTASPDKEMPKEALTLSAANNRSYEEVVIQEQVPSENAPAPPTPKHTTIIQIGQATKTESTHGTGGQKPPPNPKPSSVPPSVVGPLGDVYTAVKVTGRSLRKDSDTSVDEAVKKVFPEPRRSASIVSADPKIPLKRNISNEATREQGDTSHYSQIEITKKDRRYSVGSKSTVLNGKIPGFHERLPKVQGPVSFPAAWYH
ncbi:tyrosine-protein phosphatase non-receptor type 12-like [Physella acuta]|uniref:tyrosine-protein phosphatase non-receptor type 12-like n=1 Tax=Physella acuta TaxID=109671 RepID=UPI0027DCDC32|nr:tyrosine-protein phosphatase non-receptor type 12-like [Physella acuta]XP_059161435.1 tyrosine-protein phosphatase non-receptor type 12-like [Physella acuta]XP_059161436.1 tyrosine-protein phosphatase non-receptor type 12-like [Physella acuta]XP_059161437.1 tyrosine-protein phosphatase non-receptor type 12-like [Physella acuta]